MNLYYICKKNVFYSKYMISIFTSSTNILVTDLTPKARQKVQRDYLSLFINIVREMIEVIKDWVYTSTKVTSLLL